SKTAARPQPTTPWPMRTQASGARSGSNVSSGPGSSTATVRTTSGAAAGSVVTVRQRTWRGNTTLPGPGVRGGAGPAPAGTQLRALPARPEPARDVVREASPRDGDPGGVGATELSAVRSVAGGRRPGLATFGADQPPHDHALLVRLR